jgi:hypothetical protein
MQAALDCDYLTLSMGQAAGHTRRDSAGSSRCDLTTRRGCTHVAGGWAHTTQRCRRPGPTTQLPWSFGGLRLRPTSSTPARAPLAPRAPPLMPRWAPPSICRRRTHQCQRQCRTAPRAHAAAPPAQHTSRAMVPIRHPPEGQALPPTGLSGVAPRWRVDPTHLQAAACCPLGGVMCMWWHGALAPAAAERLCRIYG